MDSRPTPVEGRIAVLVVDDDAAVGNLIVTILERNGYEASLAMDADHARRLTADRPFAAALIDARLPGDGVALREELERAGPLRGRTILMSGGAARPEPGPPEASRFLAKPFDFSEMLRLLESVAKRGGAGE